MKVRLSGRLEPSAGEGGTWQQVPPIRQLPLSVVALIPFPLFFVNRNEHRTALKYSGTSKRLIGKIHCHDRSSPSGLRHPSMTVKLGSVSSLNA